MQYTLKHNFFAQNLHQKEYDFFVHVYVWL